MIYSDSVEEFEHVTKLKYIFCVWNITKIKLNIHTHLEKKNQLYRSVDELLH